MASRMERYYEDEVLTTGRSKKNKSLYEQIQDLDNYTNIEGVASIENNNEIDISRVKKMINNRENYKKERELRTLLNEKEDLKEEISIEHEEEKNYDINIHRKWRRKKWKNGKVNILVLRIQKE